VSVQEILLQYTGLFQEFKDDSRKLMQQLKEKN
jgi:hypothetical protein